MNKLVLLLLFPFFINAQKPRNHIKFRFSNPFILELGYEKPVQQDKSVLINVRYGLHDFSDNFDFPNGESYALTIGFRNYLHPTKTLSAFYIEGELGAGLTKSSGSRYLGREEVLFGFSVIDVPVYARGTAEAIVGHIGINLGYQKRWNVFSLDFGLGIQYNTPLGGDQFILLSDGSSIEFPAYVKGFTPKAYFGVGFAF
ncbi:hypothetical protein OAM07_05545 [Crocinitomicaceae bacterium]|nr:hypothetical protein [Crocinitomicaceae bacterium]